MFPNMIRYEAQLVFARTKIPAMCYTAVTKMIESTKALINDQKIKEDLYERAIGQHLFRSATPHKNPTRFGDFEVKGRTSDF